MWFVLFELRDMNFHKWKRVRNSFGLSRLRIRLFCYLFDYGELRRGAMFTERDYNWEITVCQWLGSRYEEIYYIRTRREQSS
jgi:hypothetical protein